HGLPVLALDRGNATPDGTRVLWETCSTVARLRAGSAAALSEIAATLEQRLPAPLATAPHEDRASARPAAFERQARRFRVAVARGELFGRGDAVAIVELPESWTASEREVVLIYRRRAVGEAPASAGAVFEPGADASTPHQLRRYLAGALDRLPRVEPDPDGSR